MSERLKVDAAMKQAWALCRANMSEIIKLALLLNLPLIAAKLALHASATSWDGSPRYSRPMIFCTLILTLLLLSANHYLLRGAVTRMALRSTSGIYRQGTLRGLAWQLKGAMLSQAAGGVTLMAGMCVPIGAPILYLINQPSGDFPNPLVLLGILLLPTLLPAPLLPWPWLAFGLPAQVVTRQGPTAAFALSASLTRGHKTSLLAVMLSFGLMLSICWGAGLSLFIAGRYLDGLHGILLTVSGEGLAWILSALPNAWVAATLTLLFVQRCERGDEALEAHPVDLSLDREALADELAAG